VEAVDSATSQAGEVGNEARKMNSWLAQNWQAVAAVALVTVVAGLSFVRPSACSLPAAPSDDPTTNTKTQGEDSMRSVARTGTGVEHANEANFDQLVLSSDVPVLVDFYADWCGPCRMIAPLLEELASEVPNARIVKVNVDHSPGLAAQYGVSSIPTLTVFDNGRVVQQQVGLASKAQLRAMLGS
jgi:thioredoxin 1